MNGYRNDFIDKYIVDLPDYAFFSNDLAKRNDNGNELLDYIYYSVIQSKSRRIPILTASNIMRPQLLKADREGEFKADDRIESSQQLSTSDYKGFNSITPRAIAKGHMTKREDVQWDETADTEKAKEAAEDTFFYTNAVPQHANLNNGPWKLLENSIMIKGRVPKPEKVCVFTGPVLATDDPLANVRLKDGSDFRVPVIFWKVIYYTKEDGRLYHAGFMMGQINPLIRDKFITEQLPKSFKPGPFAKKPFLEFRDDKNFQVPVSLIEQFTRLKFKTATDPHQDKKPVELVMTDIQVKRMARPGGLFIPHEDADVPVKGLSV